MTAQVADTWASYQVVRTVEQFTGSVVSVRSDDVAFPDGNVATRDVVVHPGAVGIIALDPEDRVLLLQQYRHPPRRLLWEPPAGLLDVAGEHPLDAAKRELYEEAGLRATEWLLLTDHFTSPGMCDEALRIYLARGLTAVGESERFVGSHEEVDMPVEWVPLADAVGLVLTGQLHNPTAVVGIMAAELARSRGFAGLRPADAPWPERPEGAGSRA